MSIVLETIIAGIALANICATGIFNTIELILEKRKTQERQTAASQIIEINNIMKDLSSSSEAE